MPQPTGGDPVNVMSATSGWSTSALPTSPPPPVTTLSQPGGRPHSSSSRSASAMAENGVWLAGFSTTGQPAAIAGASLCATRFSGKLNGLIAPTTPTGTRRTKPSLPSPASLASSGTISPVSVRATAAANWNVLTARSASTRAVFMGFAASTAMVRAKSSWRSASSSAARSRISARRHGGERLAAQHRRRGRDRTSTSAAVHFGTRPTSDAVVRVRHLDRLVRMVRARRRGHSAVAQPCRSPARNRACLNQPRNRRDRGGWPMALATIIESVLGTDLPVAFRAYDGSAVGPPDPPATLYRALARRDPPDRHRARRARPRAGLCRGRPRPRGRHLRRPRAPRPAPRREAPPASSSSPWRASSAGATCGRCRRRPRRRACTAAATRWRATEPPSPTTTTSRTTSTGSCSGRRSRTRARCSAAPTCPSRTRRRASTSWCRASSPCSPACGCSTSAAAGAAW